MSMQTTPAIPERNVGLDVVRVVATTTIVIYHILGFGVSGFNLRHADTVGPLLDRLCVGVPIFFVLSGFLVSRPLIERFLSHRDLPPLWETYARRLSRVLPAFWLALVVLTLLDAVNVLNTKTFLRNVLLVHTLFPETVFTGVTQAWTLSIEVSFYLALPLVFAALHLATKRRSERFRAMTLFSALSLMAVSAYPFLWFWSENGDGVFRTANIWLPAHLDSLASGVLMALFVVASERSERVMRLRRRLSRLFFPFLIGSFLAFYASSRIGLPLNFSPIPFRVHITGQLLFTLTSILFVFPFAIRPLQSSMRLRPIVWLSTVSYGVYLWHRMLMSGELADKYMPYEASDGRVMIRVLVIIPASVLMGAVSFYLVERPINEWVRRWTTRRTAASGMVP